MPLNIDFQQIFLHLLNFTILFAALDLLLYRPVKAFMDARAAGYAEKDRQARETLEEAERVKADYERKLAEASGEIRRQKEQSRRRRPPTSWPRPGPRPGWRRSISSRRPGARLRRWWPRRRRS